MLPFRRLLTRRAAFVLAFGGLTAAAAGAGTMHSYAVSQTAGAGSLGATNFLNTQSSGGAVQAQVGPSALTSLTYPFGLFGLYNSSQIGFGVVGLSTTSYGVAAQSTSSYPSIYGLAGGTGPAIAGETPSTSSAEAMYLSAGGSGDGADIYAMNAGIAVNAEGNEGVVGTGEGDVGVEGDSYGPNTAGVYGYSNSGDGVHGEISGTYIGAVGINNGSGYGAAGVNRDSATPKPTDPPQTFAGNYGESSTGTGVYGQSDLCVPATTGCTPYAGQSQRGAGVFGFAKSGPGLMGDSGYGMGVYAENRGNEPTIYAENYTGTGDSGMLFEAVGIASGKKTIAFANGDFYTDGEIYSGTDTYQAVTRNPQSDAMTYSAQKADATVEDDGTARLVNGTASVPLAADFRQTINEAARYLVFITPAGENHGLYVASRSPAGFVVRENQNGRSTVDFDYRIVAQPYGAPHERLPHLRARLNLPTVPARRDAWADPSRSEPAELLRTDPDHAPARLAAMHRAHLAARANHLLRRGAPPPVPAGAFKLSGAHSR